jgi:flagellar biosynthetic protein FlhB
MAAPGQDEDKELDPTAKKLEDARKKGDIAKSQEINTAVAYGGLMLAFAMAGGSAVQGMLDAGGALLAGPDMLLRIPEDTLPRLGEMVGASMLAAFPIFAIPAVAVILSLFAQRAIVFAPDKLQPKLSRLSLLENAKNKFGRSGLFEFAKSFVKLIVLTFVLGYFALSEIETVVMSAALETGQAIALTIKLSADFLSIVLVLAVAIGVIDYIWQRFELMRRNRMSYKDMKDEAKEAEGDPLMKQQRRQKAMEIATNRMLADVPEASVVIVNPTHYAVALKWDPLMPGAPVCVAKGVDEIAARIREIADREGIPIHSDPPTARALHASVEVGAEVAPDHYRPVAAAIRFAEKIRLRAKANGWGKV